MRAGGFTLIELLVVILIIAIISAIGYFNFLRSLNPVRDATTQLVGELARIRADAMANTLAYRLILEDSKTLRVETALNCDRAENTTLPAGVAVNWKELRKTQWPDLNRSNTVELVTPSPAATPNVIVCYSSRGTAQQARSLKVRDAKTSYTIDIALGGGVDYYAAP